MICGFHFVCVRMQNKSSRSEESLLVFTYRNIQSEAAELSSNAPRLINRDPSAVEETSCEQNHRRLPYIELHSETQCVRVLLSLHENGESTKTCVSGRTEQLTQLFLWQPAEAWNCQLCFTERHFDWSQGSKLHRYPPSNLSTQILKIITGPAVSSRAVSLKTAICFNLWSSINSSHSALFPAVVYRDQMTLLPNAI